MIFSFPIVKRSSYTPKRWKWWQVWISKDHWNKIVTDDIVSIWKCEILGNRLAWRTVVLIKAEWRRKGFIGEGEKTRFTCVCDYVGRSPCSNQNWQMTCCTHSEPTWRRTIASVIRVYTSDRYCIYTNYPKDFKNWNHS
jgi:hypothetical protein